MSNIKLDQFLTGPFPVVCNYENSSYKYSYLRHIIMADLRIIQETKLEKFFTKGPKNGESGDLNNKITTLKVQYTKHIQQIFFS